MKTSSTSLKIPQDKKRNFFLDIHPTKQGKHCLQISISDNSSNMTLSATDSSLILYEEDLFRFSQALSKVIAKFPMSNDTKQKFMQSKLFEEMP